jgi:hypothetical protein
MHGLQEIIYANANAAQAAKAIALKNRRARAHQTIAKLTAIRAWGSEYITVSPNTNPIRNRG